MAQSTTIQTFSCQIIGLGDLNITPVYIIYSSTELSEKFSAVIEGANWYPLLILTTLQVHSILYSDEIIFFSNSNFYATYSE